MKKNRFCLFINFLILTLYSCSCNTFQSVRTEIDQPTPHPLVKTETPIPLTLTPMQSPIPNNPTIVGDLLEKKCIKVENQIINIDPSSNLILFPRIKGIINYNGIYIYNLATREKYLLPTGFDVQTKPIISPDGKHIAYNATLASNEKQHFLLILSGVGILEKKIDLDGDFGSFLQWQNNYDLIISQKGDPSDINNGIHWNIYLYNLQNAAKKLFKIPLFSNYPGGFTIYSINSNDTLSNIIISWGGNHPDSKVRSGYEILDLLQQKTSFLYGVDLGLYQHKNPIWYDSAHVIIMMKENKTEDLYLIDMNGNPKRLTNLENYFDFSELSNWVLSPDRKKLAFYAYTGKNKNWDSNLYILDMETNKLTNTCLKEDDIRNSDPDSIFTSVDFYGPVWSPDSQHILLENRYDIQDSQLYLIDLQNSVMESIAKNTQPLGWISVSK